MKKHVHTTGAPRSGVHSKAGGGASRLVATCMAIVAMIFGIVLSVGVAPAMAADGDPTLDAPTHTKTVMPNGDGTYTISLDVTGGSKQSAETKTTPVDVVVVVDVSGSMSNTAHGSSSTRLDVVNKAITAMAQNLLTSANAQLPESQQTQMSVIPFSTHAGRASDFTSNANTIASTVNRFNANGGTNWEAALKAANSASSGRPGAKKYIVFLSDGDPTFRDSAMGASYWGGDGWNVGYGVYGTGSSDPNGRNFNAAVLEAKKREDATLYSIGIDEASKMGQFASQTSGTYFHATDEDGLKKEFQKITEEIKMSVTYANVTVTDKLSDWFVGSASADGKPSDFTYTKTQDGKTTAWEDAPAANVSNDGIVTWDVASNNAQLEAGVTYTVSFKVKPTQKAYDEAANGHKDVDNKDANNFYTNDNNSAKVSYQTVLDVNGNKTYSDTETVGYEPPSPVVLPTSTIMVNKVWDDNSSANRPSSVTVQLYKDDDTFGGPVTLNAENNWTYTYTVPTSVGSSPYRYKVVETPVDGYDTSLTYDGNTYDESYALGFQGAKSFNSTVTITNTLAVADLSVTKKVDGNAANTSKEYSFTITKKDDSSLSGDYGTDSNGNKVTFAEGIASFTLKHGQTLDLKSLPKGEYTVSENELDKTTSKVTTQLDDRAATEQAINGGSVSVTITVGGTKSVTFTNTSELKPATGVITNNGPLVGLLATSVAGIAALAAFALRRSHDSFGKHDAWKE